MGLDSVQIVLGWEESFGISIGDDEARTLRTPRQATDLISGKLNALDGPQRACLTLRAFHRLRSSIVEAAGISRENVRPEARIRDLVGSEGRRTWERVRAGSGLALLPSPGWFSTRTVGDLTRWAVSHAAKELKNPGEGWTRTEIRYVVRAVVAEVTGVDDFLDDADFVFDIGID
jgi:hypothetical protein